MRVLAPAVLLALAACAPRATLPPPAAAPEDARLAPFAPDVRTAIRERRVMRGMSPEAVRLAWGEPATVARSISSVVPGLSYERWSYAAGAERSPAPEVWFADGKVVDATGLPTATRSP